MNRIVLEIKSILALTKASLISLTKNKSSIVFGLIFPIVFISIFGLIGSGQTSLTIYYSGNTENPIYKTIESIESITISEDINIDEAKELLKTGEIDGILEVSSNQINKYSVNLITSDASGNNKQILESIVNGIADKINLSVLDSNAKLIDLKTSQLEGRTRSQIDFVLPGQLGFSLLSSGIFGTAFILLSLKETLVLKRFLATPIKKSSILIAEGLSRLVFSSIQTFVLIMIGYFAFDFTLLNGLSTLFAMLGLVVLGLTVFLGFGFLVSALSKTENNVASIANIFTLPQFLLTGTFFPLELLPDWLATIGRVLPLTHLNEAMREVSFNGASYIDILPNILWLLVWGIVVYTISIKLFKWDD